MRSLHLKIIAISLLGILGTLAFLEFGNGPGGGSKPYSVHGAESSSAADLDAARANVESVGDSPNQTGERIAVIPEESDVSSATNGPPDLSLRGRVISAGGAPLAGVRVFVEPKQSWLTLPLGIEPVPGISGWRGVEEALTDDDGVFVFEELRSASYVLEAHDAEHRPARSDKLAYVASEGLDVGDIQLESGAILRGRVFDARGQGVAGAILLESLSRPRDMKQTAIPGRGRPVGETDSTGQFRLANLVEGELLLIVDSPEHLPTEVDAIAVERGEPNEELIVHLDSGYPLEGKVEGVAADRLERLRVTARLKDASGNSNSGEPRRATDGRPRTVACDTSGKFRVSGLIPGKDYRLTAFELGDDEKETLQRLPEIDPVYARPGDVGVVLGLKLASTIRFRVVNDATGEPVTRFVARAGYESMETFTERGETKHEHAGGIVVFDGLRRTEESTTAKVEVRSLGFAEFSQADIELKAGEEQDLGDLRLTPAPKLHVTVKDGKTGRIIPGAYVYAGKSNVKQELLTHADASTHDEPLFGADLRGAPVDDRGVASLELITGEASLVLVSAEGYATFEFPEQNFAGEEDVELSAKISRGGAVTVHVVDNLDRAVEGVTVLFHRLDDEDFTNEWVMLKPDWRTDSSGDVVFDELRTGEYGFRVAAESDSMNPDYANLSAQDDWTRVSVEDGSTHEIQLTTHSRSSVEGVVYEDGAPLASADLTLIELVDGEPVRQHRGGFYFGSSGADPNRTRTDDDGNYRFDGVKAGDYRIRVSHPTRYMTTEVPVTILDEATAKDIRLSVASIEGRITDQSGAPIEGIRVRADTPSGARGNSWSPGGMELGEDEEGSVTFSTQSGTSFNSRPSNIGTRTGSDGRYVIRGVRPDEEINLTINDSMHTTVSETLEALRDGEVRRDVDFALGGAGVLRCDFDGMPAGVDRLSVVAQLVQEGDAEPVTRTRSVRSWDPKARMRSLLPGSWKVEVRLRDGTVLRTFESEVTAGETTRVRVEFP